MATSPTHDSVPQEASLQSEVITKSSHCQAELEAKLEKQWLLVRKGIKSTMDAFNGPAEDWIMKLGIHNLFLNPFYRRWMYYNRTHNTWDDTGFGPGEVLFVALDKILGVKKLPDIRWDSEQTLIGKQPDALTEWYIYLYKGKLEGPILEAELKHRLSKCDLPADIPVFSAAMTEWQRADALGLVSPAITTAKQKSPYSAKAEVPTSAIFEKSKPDPQQALSCPKCQTGYESGDVFCANCGFDLRTAITESPQTCPNCGEKIEEDDVYCANCGIKL